MLLFLHLFQWEDFMKLGEEESDDVLNERQANQYVNKCCSLIYTVSLLDTVASLPSHGEG